ncbi:MAG: FtsX-like permease family protein [Gordonia sp. (in: high G+C Gram-positive bacteria)]|uniref:ABC transporter permease n=1 Tax=Gordonia sp. (in: high G+C Gram-positive bacteria) TaxID=84139 RepID=UPI0039E272B6
MSSSTVMRKVSLRNLAAHKLRLLLSVFSVVLGTSFVAASVIFTATVQNSFNQIFDNIARGVDTQVTATEQQSPGVPVALVDKIRAARGELGIDRVQTNYTGMVSIAAEDGSALQTGGAPSIGSGYVPPDQAVVQDDTKYVEGHAPQAPGEVALNKSAAENGKLKVGAKTRVALSSGDMPTLEVTLVGIYDMPSATGGFANVVFTQDQARELFSDGDFVQMVDLSAVAGVSDTQLRDRVNEFVNTEKRTDSSGREIDPIYTVRTGDEVRQDQKDAMGEVVTVFRYVLLAFAAIGLIVGTFIIYNTFSMIVAQRNRELALLRAIGASRKNVSRSVLLEALVVGILGGGVGLGLGIGIAALMQTLTADGGIPQAGLTVGFPAILSAIFVGVVVTLLSAWIPAQRASGIPPVEAMRMSSAEPGAGSLKVRTLIGVGFAVVGVLALIGGIVASGVAALLLIALAAILLIVAVVLGGPALAGPVVGGMGRLLQVPFGTVGKLARTNAVRNPRRSAATAFALTIGLVLVVVIGTIGASFQTAVDRNIDQQLSADFVVSGNNAPMSAAVGRAVARVPDAQTTVSFDVTMGKLDGLDTPLTSAFGGPISDVMGIEMLEGAAEPAPDGILVSESVVATRGWKVGQKVDFSSTTGVTVPVTVSGVFKTNQALGDWLLGNEAFKKLLPSPMSRMTFLVLVKSKPGVSESAMRTRLEEAVKPFLTAQVQSKEQFRNSFAAVVDVVMNTLYALLSLALVIAVLGVVNTLALSVVERRREIGMLRAIGMSRAQLRRTIYLESSYIAVFGALLGVVVGLAIGLPLVRALRHWGFDAMTVPWDLIVITLVGSAVVGVIAAVWPAINAARTKPLEAISE